MSFSEPFIILFIAHLIGDFVLQTEQMALKKGFVYRYLLLHAFQLGAITWILCWSWCVWPAVLVVFLSHLVFDWIKPRLAGSPLKWYILDQVAHVLTLVVSTWYLMKIFEENGMVQMPLTQYVPLPVQFLISAYIFVGRPLTIGMGLFLKPWQDELLKKSERISNGVEGHITGLTRSSEWIGNIERFFALTVVLADMPVLIAGLLICKALLRSKEVAIIHERHRADYILIGSLGSISMGLIVGLITRWAVGGCSLP